MLKVVKNVQQIPLIDILQMEEDGVDAFERIKIQMAVQIVYDLPKELFDKLFKTTITDPRSEEQWFDLIKQFKEKPTSYNQSLLNRFKELKNRELAEIEMILQINTD